MGRVLGRIEYIDWHANLATQIVTNHESLNRFKCVELEDTYLVYEKEAIEICYNTIKEAILKHESPCRIVAIFSHKTSFPDIPPP